MEEVKGKDGEVGVQSPPYMHNNASPVAPPPSAYSPGAFIQLQPPPPQHPHFNPGQGQGPSPSPYSMYGPKGMNINVNVSAAPLNWPGQPQQQQQIPPQQIHHQIPPQQQHQMGMVQQHQIQQQQQQHQMNQQHQMVSQHQMNMVNRHQMPMSPRQHQMPMSPRQHQMPMSPSPRQHMPMSPSQRQHHMPMSPQQQQQYPQQQQIQMQPPPPSPQQNYQNSNANSVNVGPEGGANSTGELQNELLKQLLQNTPHAASMNQVMQDGSPFSLLNACLTTKPHVLPMANTNSAPLRSSHLSEAATRIPQPAPRPFENSMQIQSQQQQQQEQQTQQLQVQQQHQLQQQLHQQQQQQSPQQQQQIQQNQIQQQQIQQNQIQQQHIQQNQIQQQQIQQNQIQQHHIHHQQQQHPPPQSPMPGPVRSPAPAPFRHPPQVYNWNSNVNAAKTQPQPQPQPLTSPRLSAEGPPPIRTPPSTPHAHPNDVMKLGPKPDLDFSHPPNLPGGNSNILKDPPPDGHGIEHKPMLDMTMFRSLSPALSTPKKSTPMDDEAKKAKRRQYQAKRRQTQIKEQQQAQLLLQSQNPSIPQSSPTAPGPKKRARKASKVEETYDGVIENLMGQIRRLPPVGVVEPEIERNYSICECFGQNDLSNLKFKSTANGHGLPWYVECGDLEGEIGTSSLTHRLDYYNAQSPGEDTPVRLTQQQMQRGFYHQEFACPRVLLPGDKSNRTPTPVRDTDSPDTIVSSSSPECGQPSSRSRFFPGLRLIEPEERESDSFKYSRDSPDITIRTPIPIRPVLWRGEGDKENQIDFGGKRFGFRNNGNVSVTLTLSASAAEDIGSVLRDLANILALSPSAALQGSGGTAQAKGLADSYVIKSKDGKEFDDIQSILNGATKFCRHCDVIILNNVLKKSVADFPGANFPVSPDTLECPNEFYFCSTNCFVQLSMAQGLSTGMECEEKPGSVVNHPSEAKMAEGDKGHRKRTAAGAMGTTIPDEDGIGIIGDEESPKKKWKGIRYKYWNLNTRPEPKYKKPSDKEMTEMLFRLGVPVLPPQLPEDTRKCLFCAKTGDGISNGPARLLNVDVDKWVHLNCALWSKEVYETENGGLVNLEAALKQSQVLTCVLCSQKGATVKCFKNRCSSSYHLGCAVKEGCVFYKNKTVYCSAHISKEEKPNELKTLKVNRRVYVQRDENRQVGAVLHHSHADSQNYILRVGSLILLNIGQLLPHQLPAFHSREYIYPIGYKIVRFYWSMKRLNKRCEYICSIHEVDGRPEFRIYPQAEPGSSPVPGTSASQCLKASTARGAWLQVVEPIARLRQNSTGIKIFPKYITGEDLFGLTEPSIVKVLESLPGVETLKDYHFKYGRNPLLELPLAINPTGCARSEPKLRTHFKRPHHGTQRTTGSFATAANNSANLTSNAYLSEFGLACPYSKQFVHSKSSQYKKMKQEWRNNIYLARSKIQGLGLYAARDIEKHTMVIEYIGEIIRKKLADRRENRYEAQNRGIYMFRVDDDRVIDATLCGGLARYINHSCNPNCVTETVEVDREMKIIIFANRRISRGEELAYDYKFEFEDAQHKIPCLCGASSCRKWMN